MHQIATTISKLQYAGYWDKFDILYFLQAYDSATARINWKSPGTFNMTAVNSPTFTKDGGFTGNATSAYLATAYTPDGNLNYQQDNACLGFKIASIATTFGAAGKTIAGQAGGTLRININPQLNAFWQGRFNDVTNVSTANTTTVGSFVEDRTLAASHNRYLDGALLASPRRLGGLSRRSDYILGLCDWCAI